MATRRNSNSKSTQTDERRLWTLAAIVALRDESKSKGIHAVYSGYNTAYKAKFGEESKGIIDAMEADGQLVKQFRKGGVMLYLPSDAPKADFAKANAERAQKTISTVDALLAKMQNG